MRFFVYDLIDPRDGSIFYVGKGCGNRPYQHVREAKRGKRSRKCGRIREIIDSGLSVVVKIVKRFDSSEDAYSYEAIRISEIGLENLTNAMPGGAGGAPSNKPSSKTIEPIELTASMIETLAKFLRLRDAGYRVTMLGKDISWIHEFALNRLVELFGKDRITQELEREGVELRTDYVKTA